jgi:ribonuclease HII
MAYLIGTDEAGYGPNLGPLVIAATVWHRPDSCPTSDLYERLDQVVIRRPPSPGESRHVPIADSKQLYKSGEGLATLESGVFPACAATGVTVNRWRDIWQQLAPATSQHLSLIPWYRDFDMALPCDAQADQLALSSQALRDCLGRNRIQLRAIRARVVLAEEFNELIDRLGGKGALLSTLTIDLVGELITSLGDQSILVHCDKHGGRKRYGPLLQQRFPEQLVEVRREERASSLYRWGPSTQRTEFRFEAKGESFLPSALASMVAKYLRELAMKAFNRYWQTRIPGLRATAGYPVDARRFVSEIADVCRKDRIDRDCLWRKR